MPSLIFLVFSALKKKREAIRDMNKEINESIFTNVTWRICII